jgi:haloalkane dehalogenase
MRIDFVPDRALYPFESRWLDTSGGRMHYVDEGAGPPILLCHGNPTWSFLYRHLIRALSGRFRCVAVDYLGFGLSERPAGYGYTAADHVRTVGELVDHLGLERLVVMGQDWGGPIGMGVAVERVERIAGVVLGNTWCWPSDAVRLKMFGRIMGSAVFQHLILRRNFFVERLVPAGITRRLNPAEMDHYRMVQPSPEARVGVAVLPKQILAARPLLEWLGREVPARLGTTPALLVWGMRDPGFRAGALLPRLQSIFPDHVLLELPDAKHYIQEDAPAPIAEAIIARFGRPDLHGIGDV